VTAMTAARVLAGALAVVGVGLAAQAQTALRPAPPDYGPTAEWQACERDFTELRREAEERAVAAFAARKKAKREELCHLVSACSAAEEKWIAFSLENRAKCGLSEELLEQIKHAHAGTEEVRAKLCGGQPKRLKDFKKIAGR